jgi:cell division protein FtsI (penicillin-binding protein 3)
MQGLSPQQTTIHTRLPFVIIFLVSMAGFLLIQLANFQFYPREVAQELELRGDANANSIRRIPAERGLIYDRGGEALAFNALQYGVGISPNLVSEPRRLATELALILEQDEFELYQTMTSDENWVLIARPISAEQGQAIADLDEISITIEPIPRRFYPQGSLAGHAIGFVIDDGLKGAMGVEGSYNASLAGRVLDQTISNIPFDLPEEAPTEQRGQDIVLTIDRDIQFWVESELFLAINESGATRGTVIVMNPKNGDVLAMASYPDFDPNNFADVEDPDLLRNPAISDVYEPGSVMKVMTVASALEKGTISRDWVYNDQGRLEIGGIVIENWDKNAYGVVDVAQILIRSLNIGATSIALEMGTDDFYSMMRSFGIGQPTGIDLFAEESGILKVPGDSDWSESDLATNSFGQGVSVTPLQMATMFSAIANDGIMRQPRIVKQIVTADGIQEAQPTTIRRVISAETADIVTDMMVRTVNEGIPQAILPGYTIAGKTGTAEIPTAIGYEDDSIVTFAGFLPADDPEVVIFVKLDRPDGYWGSQVAAPVFKRLADRLVILLEIPVDNVRLTLANTETNPEPENG